MKREIVLKYVMDLDWKLPKETQDNAIKMLMNIDPQLCHLLIQPMLKSTWHNAAIVIKSLGYPHNEQALDGLIWLLQDLNWPGITNAFEILKGIDKKILLPLLGKNVKKAYIEQDFMWLGGIKYFIQDATISETDFDDKTVFDLLAYADYSCSQLC